MNASRIRMGHPYGETPPNIYADFDWVRRNETALLEKYGECCIVVYREQVLGVGATYEAAVEDAERNLSPDVAEVTPILKILRRRHPFLRVRPIPVQEPAQDKK